MWPCKRLCGANQDDLGVFEVIQKDSFLNWDAVFDVQLLISLRQFEGLLSQGRRADMACAPNCPGNNAVYQGGHGLVHFTVSPPPIVCLLMPDLGIIQNTHNFLFRQYVVVIQRQQRRLTGC